MLWMVLAVPGYAAAADFDEGFTSFLRGNYTQAFKIWRPLAEAGEVEAQFGLGLLYEKGQGVRRDLETAASWYKRAAEQGSMRAQTQIGGMYARGDGVPEDWDKAIAWWRRAAAQGSERAKFHLGQAYHYGSGVGRDLDLAMKWYDEAAAQGFRPAALQVQEIMRLREEQAAAAKQAAAEPTATSPQSGSSDGGSASVLLPLAISRSSSGFFETADDIKTQGATSLIALGITSNRPLDGEPRIYLASYRSIQKASEGWQGIAATNADLLGGLDAAVDQVDLGREKGIVYRLQAGPLPDVEDANALCYKLNQRSIPCLVVSP